MAGNEILRRELDAAMNILEPAAYASRLAELQEQFGHRIKVVDRHRSFNCYAYAFGLSKHPDFVSLVYRTQKTAVMDSAFVAKQLARGRLTEIDPSKIAAGTIALYFDGGPTHAALVRGATPPLVLESKWGPSELHSHGLWEVPASYGDQVRFYALTDIEELLDLLFEKEASMTDAYDFEEREQRTRAFLTDKVQRAIKLRSKDRESHGSGLLEVMVTVNS